jgi:hypothetical protein
MEFVAEKENPADYGFDITETTYKEMQKFVKDLMKTQKINYSWVDIKKRFEENIFVFV